MKSIKTIFLILSAAYISLVMYAFKEEFYPVDPKFIVGDCVKMIIDGDEFTPPHLSSWTLKVNQVGKKQYQLKGYGELFVESFKFVHKNYQKVNCGE